jgi:hypothetical protein
MAAASGAVAFANLMAYCEVHVLNASTLTGIGYWVGGVSAGNVRSALYESAGNRVANRTTNVAQAAINTFQQVAFDSTYAATPGVYFAAIIFDTATATHFTGRGLARSGGAVQGGFATPATITVPTTPVAGTGAAAYTTY